MFILGNVYSSLGDNKKATEFYEEALEYFRKTLPENDESTADTLNNLANVNLDLGDQNIAQKK